MSPATFLRLRARPALRVVPRARAETPTPATALQVAPAPLPGALRVVVRDELGSALARIDVAPAFWARLAPFVAELAEEHNAEQRRDRVRIVR